MNQLVNKNIPDVKFKNLWGDRNLGVQVPIPMPLGALQAPCVATERQGGAQGHQYRHLCPNLKRNKIKR